MVIEVVLVRLYSHNYIAKKYLNKPIIIFADGENRFKPIGKPTKRMTEMSMNQSGRSVVQISQNADYFFRRATEASHAGDYLQALMYYDRALSTDPHYAGAWHEKGNCLDELGRCEEAIASYEEAIKHDPFNAETWFNKGLLLKRMGKESEAFRCINHGIDLALGR